MDDPLALTAAAALGLMVLQFCGLMNLLLGAAAGRWDTALMPMLVGYGLALIPQLLLCCAAGLVAWILRRILLVQR
jgi:biotin transport system substrate-specific component